MLLWEHNCVFSKDTKNSVSMLDKMWGEKFTDLTRPPLHSGNAFRHQTLGDVVVMWIIERRHHTFLIRVVCLDFML